MTDAAVPRWRGQPGRLEVWYASATDIATGMGLWLHYELVAPTADAAYLHGWLATFPVDGPPSYERFGPEAVTPAGEDWMSGSNFSIGPTRLTGTLTGTAWDLEWATDEPPMWTMSKATWQREILPSSHVVLAPKARLIGIVNAQPIDAVGNLSHIYGHGNAQRWAWLHADLDDTTSLEVIAAVGRRPALRRLPPLAFVQLRRHGHDWPSNPLASAALFRAKLGQERWSVRGIVGRHRLSVDVVQPADRCVILDYRDPDGATATCSNTETADVEVRLEKFTGRWRVENYWRLEKTAHAERGYRGS
ncbi:MAG: hypothetical protein JO246_01845 [Frankiaceae bacterium]|nr:hypothetical protein [Frankiaceae bacterium]MBV9871055.1 hypothetical protein [Frankiaceae bacterium]